MAHPNSQVEISSHARSAEAEQEGEVTWQTQTSRTNSKEVTKIFKMV